MTGGTQLEPEDQETSGHVLVGSVDALAELIRSRPSLWTTLAGSVLVHRTLGRGVVSNVEARESGCIHVVVEFASGRKRFNPNALEEAYFISAQVPQEAAQAAATVARERLDKQRARRREEARRPREDDSRQITRTATATGIHPKHAALACDRSAGQETARQECLKLFAAYGVTGREPNPENRLFMILKKLDCAEALEEDDHSHLSRQGLSHISATYFEDEYRRTCDGWALVKASGHWRKAKEPHRALSAANNAIASQETTPSDCQLASACFTTRGGALRDLGRLTEAERSAHRAVELNPSAFHPYNLLGAISYEMGNPALGDQYFEQARVLGAPTAGQEEMLRDSVIRSQDRRTVAEYLLRKDPVKYRWASKYANEGP